jgi:predicted N-acetyltransferase YhbS
MRWLRTTSRPRARDESGRRHRATGKAQAAVIRVMTSSDFGWAVEITQKEGWGFVRTDFQRILSHTPGGSFVAVLRGKRIGMLTTMCHARTCWIGNVVVAVGHRGAGIGNMLVQAANGFAAGKMMKRTALLSREVTAGFYAGVGFHRDARFVGLGGLPRGASDHPAVVPVTPKLFSEVLVLDRESCDEERRRMLQLLARDFGRYFLVFVEYGRVLGFIVGKPGKGLVDVGPWVCVCGRPDIARALFLALAAKTKKRLEVYVPQRRRRVLNLLQSFGLGRTAVFQEMRKGGIRRRCSDMVDMLAVAGLEKG